jgi:hypothetical protein
MIFLETEPCYRAQLEKAIRETIREGSELDEAIGEAREQQRNMSPFMSPFDYSGPKFTDDELRFRDITEKMRKTFLKKNHDYGNSFHETWDEFGDKGIITALTQISHKYHRLMNIGLGTKPLVDESIDDTLLDMANYCILTIMELEKARNNEKEN